MARHHDRLEPLEDGFVAFYTASGDRWKHRDIEDARTGPGHRLFISDSGEQRHYVFGPNESHDATLFDLREQLGRSKSAGSAPRAGGEERVDGRI